MIHFIFSVLKNDNTNCLNFLMRYPHVDVITVIEYALHMSDPKVNLIYSYLFHYIEIVFYSRNTCYHL